MPTYINLSRRLVRWMKSIGLAVTPLRLRYVRKFHALHVLMGRCSHDCLIEGMQTLIANWVRTDEDEHVRAGVDSYQGRLTAAIADVQAQLLLLAAADRLPDA
jgi:hypothetical protein